MKKPEKIVVLATIWSLRRTSVRLPVGEWSVLHSHPVSIVTHGMGLNITLQSYRDHLDFGFTAAANILPNVRALADSKPIELDRLEQAWARGIVKMDRSWQFA